ncbi:MAG: TetR family transcriptional regulator [Clostridia bacterium]|nr:TetR family transcriptional regulator [Clostridia bacterium]
MIKGTPELIKDRREEIINACEKLYKTMSFKEITLKDIGNVVPFSRPTIYNYFKTKEEIFLSLFKREYDRWNEALSEILYAEDTFDKSELSKRIALSISDRTQLLKLLSMNNYDMEANSREEILYSFKISYGKSLELMEKILNRHISKMSKEDTKKFLYAFFPFMFGIYPYTSVTKKQKNAMEKAGIPYVYQSVYDLTYNCLIKLLET